MADELESKCLTVCSPPANDTGAVDAPKNKAETGARDDVGELRICAPICVRDTEIIKRRERKKKKRASEGRSQNFSPA